MNKLDSTRYSEALNIQKKQINAQNKQQEQTTINKGQIQNENKQPTNNILQNNNINQKQIVNKKQIKIPEWAMDDNDPILYRPPELYLQLGSFCERNPLYQITVDYNFLKDIATNEDIDSSHLQFYFNMFRQVFKNSNIKIATASAYFFQDFFPNLSESTFIEQYGEKNTYKQQILNQQKKQQKRQYSQDSDDDPDIYDDVQQPNQKQELNYFDLLKKMESQIQIDKKNPIQVKTLQQPQQQIKPDNTWGFQVTKIQLQTDETKGIQTVKADKLQQLLTNLAAQNNLQSIDQLTQMDYIFFPINIKNSHWINIILCLKDKKIRYFDSFPATKYSQVIVAALYILKKLGLDYQNYQVQSIQNKQSNGRDCGIFVILSLLYTYQNKLDYKYTQGNADKFRESVLYNLAIYGSQKNIEIEFFNKII